MSDENIENISEEMNNEAVLNDVVSEENDTITRALEMGWKPKEEFEGSELDWKGPGAFLKDAELFSALKQQANQIKDLNAALQDVKGFMSRSEEAGYHRAMAELQNKRKEAMDMYDLETLNQVDDEYLALQQELNNKKHSFNQVPEKSDAERAFEERNQSWYNEATPTNKLMKNEAILLSRAIAEAQPELSAEDHIKLLETKIRKLYPEKFKNSNKAEPSPVATGKKGSGSGDIDLRTIPHDALEAAKRQVRVGAYSSIEECIKDFKKFGVI